MDIIQACTLKWLVEVFFEDWKLYEGRGREAKQLAGLVDDAFQLMPSGKHMVGRDLGCMGSTNCEKNIKKA